MPDPPALPHPPPGLSPLFPRRRPPSPCRRRRPLPATSPSSHAHLERRRRCHVLWRNLSGPMEWSKPKPSQSEGELPPPVGWPRASVKDATEGSAPYSSSADEFRPAIPRSGCSPAEPVFRFTGTPRLTCTPAEPRQNRAFLFCGNRTFLLCVDTENPDILNRKYRDFLANQVHQLRLREVQRTASRLGRNARK
jgi:hypothetical protein